MNARKLLMSILVAACTATCGLVPAVSANAAALPDGRVYEMVTPPENFGSEVYQPILSESFVPFSDTETEYPFQAAANGDRVVFVGGPTVDGNEAIGFGQGNQYLGTRVGGGAWTQTNISPPEAPRSDFQAFSSDLSVGFLDSVEPLSSAAPGYGEILKAFIGNYDDLYSTSTAGSGVYSPLFTVRPPYRSKETFQTAGGFHAPTSHFHAVVFAGSSADSSHLLFLANDALTDASEGRPAAEGGPVGSFESENNLYEAVDGQPRLVNVLPDGTTHAGATFGSGPFLGTASQFSHVISADGSRIFWTDLSNGHIYVRENGTTTVEVSPTGTYQTAVNDGSRVLYTNGDLYQYEVETGNTTDLTPDVPVENVVGTSESGDYVYYVTTSGEFMLWHGGVTTPIAPSRVTRGEVTPDGHSVVFMSTSVESPARVSVYDADTGLVHCVSCAGGGTLGTLPLTNHENVYQPRWISADGSRIFFDSREPFVAQDANGKLDAYEWERPGTGGCVENEGCVNLLSGGTSTDVSYFADASESGDDVFIVTRVKLLASDDNELFDLYDVRVDGEAPVAPPSCTGTGCQGVPASPPIFATPSSVTFEGVGNLAAATKEAKAKPKPKKKSKHRKKSKKKSKAKKGARKAGGHRRSQAKGGRS